MKITKYFFNKPVTFLEALQTWALNLFSMLTNFSVSILTKSLNISHTIIQKPTVMYYQRYDDYKFYHSRNGSRNRIEI